MRVKGINAVRITGGDPDRLEIAASHAADAGLEVWFCPFTNGLAQEALLALLADCADRVERLRRRGAEIVLLTGSEISLFTVGFLCNAGVPCHTSSSSAIPSSTTAPIPAAGRTSLPSFASSCPRAGVRR